MGFLKRKTAFGEYGKNRKDIYERLSPLLGNALSNAAWLRSQYGQATPFYERNPYTSMDALMKRLFRLILPGDAVTLKEFEIVLIQSSPIFKIMIKNRHTTNRQIVSKQHFGLFDTEGNEVEFEFVNAEIIDPQQTITVEIVPAQPVEKPLRLKFPKDNEQEFIWIESSF